SSRLAFALASRVLTNLTMLVVWSGKARTIGIAKYLPPKVKQVGSRLALSPMGFYVGERIGGRSHEEVGWRGLGRHPAAPDPRDAELVAESDPAALVRSHHLAQPHPDCAVLESDSAIRR